MRPSHCQLLTLLLLVLTAPASAQLVGTRPRQEAMTLDLDSAATRRLASIEDFLAEKQWDSVATLLRQTQAEKADKLIAIAPGWYVSVARFCQCQAALLPTPALVAYRRQMDAAAKKWLDDAERLSVSNPVGQRTAWLRIVRQAFASSPADDALARLAEQSFEQADYAVARTYFEMLLPASGSLRSAAGFGLLRHPDSSANLAQIRTRLILCSLFEGDAVRANQELEIFRKLHGSSTGLLAGRDGLLSDLLGTMVRDFRLSRLPTAECPFDLQRWSVELPHNSANGVGEVVPVVAGDTLFASNGETIFAWDAASGRPKWSEAADPTPDLQAAAIHSLAAPVSPKLSIDGQSRHFLTVREERLYARLGTPITGKAKHEVNAHSELVGLDIGVGEGKLVWRVAVEEIDPQDPLSAASPWCFEGSPIADSRRVFVVLRRSLPQEQINVACFDADSARLLWNRKVGITVASTEEAVNSISHLQLTLAEDSVFLSTDAGTIAALDTHDGAIRWVRTYVSETVLPVRGGRRDGHTPPVYHDGVLYVAPLDTSLLLAIHAESGLLLWQREWPDPIRYVLGVVSDVLIVQGRSLWGVALATGDPAWPHRRVGFEDPEAWSFGRGVMIGNEVWWPNREEVVVVNAESGRIARRLMLRESLELSGGNLTAGGTWLVVSRSGQLTMFGANR